MASAAFMDNARAALNEPEKAQRRDLLGAFMPLARDAAVENYTGYEQLRKHVKSVKQHTLDNLYLYLSQFVE